MKTIIFLIVTLFAPTLVCQLSVFGQTQAHKTTPDKKAAEQPNMIKLEPKYEIKKFYIVKGFEGNPAIPFTAMVTVKNAGNREDSEISTSVGIVYLDENKKVIREMSTPPKQSDYMGGGNSCFGCGHWWRSGARVALQPGQSAVVKVPFASPPAKPSSEDEFYLKGKKWKIGIQVRVRSSDSKCKKSEDKDNPCPGMYESKEYKTEYVDFLPEQYIQP